MYKISPEVVMARGLFDFARSTGRGRAAGFWGECRDDMRGMNATAASEQFALVAGGKLVARGACIKEFSALV